jgi:hypothetical protein
MRTPRTEPGRPHPQEPMTTFLNQEILPPATLGRRSARAWPLGLLACGSAAAVLLLAPAQAHAQAASQPVSPDGKGVVGGALLGAEVVDLTMGIIGVNRGWPYLVFGALGAVGGGLGGFALEQETRSPEGALYMLAGGMALVIPTVVVSLNATMYKPPEATSDPANNEPAPAPAPLQPGPTQPQARRLLLRPVAQTEQHLRFSLVDVYKGTLAFSAPAVQVRPLYSEREKWTYGVSQGTEVRVPVFYAAF